MPMQDTPFGPINSTVISVLKKQGIVDDYVFVIDRIKHLRQSQSTVLDQIERVLAMARTLCEHGTTPPAPRSDQSLRALAREAQQSLEALLDDLFDAQDLIEEIMPMCMTDDELAEEQRVLEKTDAALNFLAKGPAV
jgi:hypothetical protein